MFPQVADIAYVTEQSCRMEKSVDVGCSKSTEWENLKQDHRVYASLSRALTSFKLSVCIIDAVSASSTDNYPRESIVNTVGPGVPQIGRRTPYWSSKGQKDPQVPEILIYRLRADFCVISEIDIQPFQGFTFFVLLKNCTFFCCFAGKIIDSIFFPVLIQPIFSWGFQFTQQSLFDSEWVTPNVLVI